MELVILILLLLITGLVFGYLILSYKFNDISVPNLRLPKKGNILIIYPHPDDELGMSGGLINKLSKRKGINLYVVSTTKGENGDELLKLPPEELGIVRKKEFVKVQHVLGTQHFEIWDFSDGGMVSQENEVKEKIKEFIQNKNINLAITYEKLGLYGHPDHIILSKIIHELSNEMTLDVLYSTLPNKILERLNLPKTLTYKDRVVELTLDKITTPEYKLNIISNLPKRYRASKEYKSQNIARGRPLWLVNLFSNYEYYTKTYSEDRNS